MSDADVVEIVNNNSDGGLLIPPRPVRLAVHSAWPLQGNSPLCTTTIKPLEEGNWKGWSVIIKGLLEGEGLGHLLEETKDETVDAVTLARQKAAVITLIWRSLSAAQTNHLTGQEIEPSEIWTILKNAHISSSASTKLSVEVQLDNLTKRKDTMQQYLLKAKGLKINMKQLEEP
ncbi:uncharacterized protein DFL_000040 [Arthrobotrys flagrans]|uniref:Uncharacterized protein n=1 Tax=Arthrobotrys flagrans TaxID=97331 RepID=A0A437AD07_ARTFL|nr:hypothetical protein DFL_000040 [Arthrobotrys flagrans]